MLVLLWTPVAMSAYLGLMICDDLQSAPCYPHPVGWPFMQRPDKTPLTHLRSYWRSDDCRAVVVTTFPAAGRP
jgi:hypothetical protein